MKSARPVPGLTEFVALIAMLSSIIALATDAMLPVLSEIGQDLQVGHENEAQLVISMVFVGLALGQLIMGPLSDSSGRKPLMYAGLALFGFGSLLSMFGTDFQTMLAGRFLQGLGAASPRILTMALVRDCYRGREMARIMSLTMLIFIIVPMLAPALGQGIAWLAGWRAIFTSFVLLAVVIGLWFGMRMPETLPAEKRTRLSLSEQIKAIKAVMSHRQTIGYTIVVGFVFGAFLGYLSSVQQILQIQYELGSQFPLYFAALAGSIGAASYLNSRLVIKFGMTYLSRLAIWLVISFSALLLLIAWLNNGHPPLWVLLIFLAILFIGFGTLFGNLNALAMEPMERHAGLGASIVGSISTFMSIPLGTLIGQLYDGTVIPLVTGFLLLSLAGYGVMAWTGRRSTPIESGT
ncbi:MAG: multidrug effflux MFS transporter [Thiolinea sp.]